MELSLALILHIIIQMVTQLPSFLCFERVWERIVLIILGQCIRYIYSSTCDLCCILYPRQDGQTQLLGRAMLYAYYWRATFYSTSPFLDSIWQREPNNATQCLDLVVEKHSIPLNYLHVFVSLSSTGVFDGNVVESLHEIFYHHCETSTIVQHISSLL